MNGLSRKEKLALWRAQKAGPGGASTSSTSAASASAGGARTLGKGKPGGGALAARPGAGNVMQDVRRATTHAPKEGPKRKPFQVDTRSVREASERRVAPGTPIHSLKKRLKRTSEAIETAPAPPAAVASTAATAAGGGADALIPTARAQGKAKAAVAARVPGHVNGVSRSLDSARMKEVSDHLKSQISEANMLLEIAGVDAARTLLAALLSCAGAGRGVGELALYWAARAKLEEEAGFYSEARHLLGEGEAYISMPTQQKVMSKVIAAFEGRMNDREEVEVARLLEDSVGSLSLNDSGANSNSPGSTAPYRYDPNDPSMDDGEDSGSPRSAIKNLNFSRIAKESEGGGSVGGRSKIEATGEDSYKNFVSSGSANSVDGGGSGSGGGVASMTGVIFSDDDSDCSVSDIDEGVIARAKAFEAEEEARKARAKTLPPDEQDLKAGGDGVVERNEDDVGAEIVQEEGDLAAFPARGYINEQEFSQEAAHCAAASVPARQPSAGLEDNNDDGIASRNGRNGHGKNAGASSSSVPMAMLPPPPKPTAMSMSVNDRESRKRKGTPHPKPVKRNTPRRGIKADEDLSPGSFFAQVEAKGKDGKRTLTPVRRSRRISGVSKEPTPAQLRKEMEAML